MVSLLMIATGKFDIDRLIAEAAQWSGLEGMDLVPEVTTSQSYNWDETRWAWPDGYGRQEAPEFHVVAIDYGLKRNILRCLATAGCRVTVLPATATAEDVMAHQPDGVFLSNGPGDPAATGVYAVPQMPTADRDRTADVRHLPGTPDACSGTWGNDA